MLRFCPEAPCFVTSGPDDGNTILTFKAKIVMKMYVTLWESKLAASSSSGQAHRHWFGILSVRTYFSNREVGWEGKTFAPKCLTIVNLIVEQNASSRCPCTALGWPRTRKPFSDRPITHCWRDLVLHLARPGAPLFWRSAPWLLLQSSPKKSGQMQC